MTDPDQHLSTLRNKAIEQGWHFKQGKGKKDNHRQDLLSHSLDVTQITYNIISALDPDTKFTESDYVSAAFFHDLHKIDRVGGTNSMETNGVEALLEDWGVQRDVLGNFSLQGFTDVLRTVHQYHGGYPSGARTRMKTDNDLRLLTHIIRLADGIASNEDLTELYTSSFRDNTEALDEINSNPKSDASSEYTLGYHQLSEIKPALGALIHDSVRNVVKEGEGVPIASRKDATIYLLPRNFDPVLIDQTVENAVEGMNEKSIKRNVPDKIRTDLYGIEVDIETEVQNRRDKLRREGGSDDLSESYRRVIESVNPDLEKGDTEDFTVTIEGDQLGTLENEEIKVGVPTTQKGYLVGDAASGLVDTLSGEVDKTRIEILEELLDNELELDEYADANWRTIQSYLARIAGNYYFQKYDEGPWAILDDLEERGKQMLGAQDEGSVTGELTSYVEEILSFSFYDDGELHLVDGSIPSDIQVKHSYQESCILCGGKGQLQYKTDQHLPYSKSYMARGKIGEATTDDWDPLLCEICFIDQALMRSFVNKEDVRIDTIQDTLFLKVYPNRYLGTQQVQSLKDDLNGSFSNLRTDSKNYLEQTGKIEETTDVLGAQTYQPDVTLYDSINIGGMQALVNSENYFLIAAEYYVQSGDNPAKQTTLTWLDAIQRSLLFYRYYNLNIEIESNPEINIEEPYPSESGVVLRSPPSHISTVFGEKIGFESADEWLEGMANLSYSLTLPQYDSDDDLNRIYSEFRSSLYPGSRIFREAERDWDDDTYGPIHASENYETYLSICTEIDRWKGKIMTEQTTNRIEEVVEAFQISIRGHPSTHLIQDPLRTMIDKILTSKNETKEEIINEAAASVYARVERKWESPDIYFGYDSDKPIHEIIEEGCRTFYEKVFEEMLEGDKIRLADQKEDILDAFYLNVKKRGAN
jgi:hypothetical protein